MARAPSLARWNNITFLWRAELVAKNLRHFARPKRYMNMLFLWVGWNDWRFLVMVWALNRLPRRGKGVLQMAANVRHAGSQNRMFETWKDGIWQLAATLGHSNHGQLKKRNRFNYPPASSRKYPSLRHRWMSCDKATATVPLLSLSGPQLTCLVYIHVVEVAGFITKMCFFGDMANLCITSHSLDSKCCVFRWLPRLARRATHGEI